MKNALLAASLFFLITSGLDAQTSLAETGAASSAAAALDAPPPQTPPPTPAPSGGEARPDGRPAMTNAAPATTPVPAEQPAMKPAPAKPEVEKAEVVQPEQGRLRIALHTMSEHRFFFSLGTLLFCLLILFSTAKTAPRRIFGTFAVVAFLFLLHYFVIGIVLPPLRANDWDSPKTRAFFPRHVKVWERKPEGQSSLTVVRMRNILGPKNRAALKDFLNEVIQKQTKTAGGANYGKGFVSNKISWSTAITTGEKGETYYIWAAEFKQQRIALVLYQPPWAIDKQKDLEEIGQLVRKIK